jgi:hypothetical protein
MIGSPRNGTVRDISTAIPNAAVHGAQAGSRPGRGGVPAEEHLAFVLGGAIVLYLVYAVLERHERLRDAVKGQNVLINLRNIAVILTTVVVGINLLKVLAAKLVAWKVPGAVHFAHIVGNA